MVSARTTWLLRIGSGLVALAAVWFGDAPSALAQTQTKIACIGEATTHSAHRIHDPEYPQLMGEFLDANFKLEAQPNPLDGGMLYGAGTSYRVGNFGLPTGTSLDTKSTEVASTIHSPQLLAAEAFAPQVVVLGPYGPHEPYAEVSVPDNFAPDLKRLAQRILAFPSQPTVFMAIPIARYGEDTDTLRRQIKQWTVQVAAELELPTIDLWTEFLGKRAEFYDQNHLALAGRQRMGRFTGTAIKAWQVAGGNAGGAGGTGTSGGASGAAGAGGATIGGSGGASVTAGPGGVGPGSGATNGGAENGGALGIMAGASTAGAASTSGATGSPPTSAGSSPASTSSSSSSCALSVGGSAQSSASGLLLLLGLSVLGWRRRRA
jgi:hypothetical protein